MAKQLEASLPKNVFVLEALADWALQQKTGEGVTAAIRYLGDAVKSGTTNPADFQQLGKLLLASGQGAEAAINFQKAISLFPYDPEPYRSLARSYFLSQKKVEECEVLDKAVRLFPLDAGIRKLSKDCETSKPEVSGAPDAIK